MSQYLISSGDGSTLYFCVGCLNLYFSPLKNAVPTCTTCLFLMRNRGILMEAFGKSSRVVLEETTLRTQTQVAEIMGISRQRVQQIEIYALSKVRAFLVKSVETHIPIRHIMNSCAIAGTLARDAVVRKSAKTGNEFVTATIVTERPSPAGDGKIFNTYWDVLAFGDRAVNMIQSLKDGTAVFATGEVECKTYEAKDGTTKAGLKLVGNLGLLSGITKEGGLEEPVF